ncbi:hypothetical protein G163CM_35020 [Pseudocitrobacter corydidari]|uniref:Uncharacterized protein n=2 Tax=Pseudocitrobacter corydidari TaxID=2891570 RepID=A0ABY3S9X1_9ENTR|nr:hypothetical protein G163CM_35020 [Pseudocitrobacter corydidari]
MRNKQMKNLSGVMLLAASFLFSALITPAHAGSNVHFSGEIYGASAASTSKCVDDAIYRMQAQRCAAEGEVPVVSTVRDITPRGARPMREVVIYSY